MTPQLQIALISAGAVVAGSIVGGMISYLTNKHLNRYKWQLEAAERLAAAREQLYGEFMAEGGRIMIAAIDEKASRMTEFAQFMSLLSRVRLVATASVIEAAEQFAAHVTDAHRDRPQMPINKEGGYATGPFIAAVREELAELRKKT